MSVPEKSIPVRKTAAFNLCGDDNRKIFNNTWNQDAKPVEMYRTDFITAMKIPDHQTLDNTFILISDPWKQEYNKGVQVPVDIDSLPKPVFKTLEDKTSHNNNEGWHLPTQYYKWKPDDSIVKLVMNGEVPHPVYDMDEDDHIFLKSINALEDCDNRISETDFESTVTFLDALSQVNMVKKYQDKLTYSLQYDDSVYCEVCKDIYSEPDNEMIFCDSCNICVHQGCYGISKIPKGEWYCTPCSNDITAPVCLLCMQGEGAFKQSNQREWIHIFCALWIPEVGFGNVEKMEPITKIKQIPASRWSLVCCFCQERVGACIQCSKKGCFVSFHPSCAYSDKCHMMTSYGTPENHDLVENFAYCLKHSSEISKEPLGFNTIIVPPCRKDESNPLYSNKFKIAQSLQHDFFEYVDILDASMALNINVSIVQFVFDYWKEKRKLNGNNPLIPLPPLSELVEKFARSNDEQEDQELGPFMKLVSIRQDLERARVLVHMSERRERLKKRYMKSLLSVIECCFEEKKPLPFKLSNFGLPLPVKKNKPFSSPICSSDNDSDLNISQSSLSKVFCSPVSQIYDNQSESMVVEHEVVLTECKQNKSRKDLAYDYHSSEDPEWADESAKQKKKTNKRSESKIKKMKELAAQFSRKITIALSDKSDAPSSQDEGSHFSTPPTSPEFNLPNQFTLPKPQQDPVKRKHSDSGSENGVFVFKANTPPSPKDKENKKFNPKFKSTPGKESAGRSRRSSKRHKPNPKFQMYDCS